MIGARLACFLGSARSSILRFRGGRQRWKQNVPDIICAAPGGVSPCWTSLRAWASRPPAGEYPSASDRHCVHTAVRLRAALRGRSRPAADQTVDVVPMLMVVVGTVRSFLIHANVRWRASWLGWLITTPAFHHWHHTNDDRRDRNYAAMLPVFDRRSSARSASIGAIACHTRSRCCGGSIRSITAPSRWTGW